MDADWRCTIAHFTMWVNIVGPVLDVPRPTSTNIFCFLPRRATDAPTRIIAWKIIQNWQWWMPSIVIPKAETRVSFCITVLLYVSRSQPGQKTHEFHLSMTTKSKCSSGIGWSPPHSSRRQANRTNDQDRWLTDQKLSESVHSYYSSDTCNEDALE